MSGMAPTPSPAGAAAAQALIDVAKANILAYNEKNWDAVRACVTEDCTYDEIATARKVQGIEDLLTCWQGWAQAFPDSKGTIEQTMAGGNMVCVEVTWRGKHTGPLQLGDRTVDPTNRMIEIRACEICEVAGDKAQNIRHYFDMATMMQQLGLAE